MKFTTLVVLDVLLLVSEYIVGLVAGTFVLSNLGMFGVDRFDAILPPGVVSITSCSV